MIGYTLFGTNDVERAKTFYDGLFETIGAGRLLESGPMCLWGVAWDKPMLGITTPRDGREATVGNGTMIAIVVDQRELVDRLHARAIELGGRCEGPPGLRGEEGPQAFYGAYFRDLDGNKLAVFRIGPA